MASPLTGQALASTGTPVQLGTANPQTFTIKAPAANANPVFIGGSAVTTATGHQLDPGETLSYERRSSLSGPTYQISLPECFLAGTTGDKVTWFGSP